jgi:hypothetical protein
LSATRAANTRVFMNAITLVMLPLPSLRSHTCRHDTVLVWSQTLPFWL